MLDDLYEMLRPAVERYLPLSTLAAREVLELAAVIGNEFEFSLIREASGMGSEQILGVCYRGSMGRCPAAH